MSDNSQWKNLKLSIENVENSLDDLIKKINENAKVSNEKKPGNLNQFKIEIPGQKIALLNVYSTKNGVTLSPIIGQNQELSIILADKISLNAGKVASNSKRFSGIPEELFNNFQKYLDQNSIEYSKTKDDNKEATLKLKSKDQPNLTIHWYKTTHTLFIQGKTSPLWDDIILWFASENTESSEDVIKILFDSYEDLGTYKIECSELMLEDILIKRLGEKIYKNENILKNYEKKWLKTSYSLYLINIELPEYYPIISSSLKVIEGVLRRTCIRKFGIESFEGKKSFGPFLQFDQEGKLKLCYHSKLKSDKTAIAYMEELYGFFKNKRHAFSHNNGINPTLIEDKKIAKEILDEVMELLKTIEKHSKILL